MPSELRSSPIIALAAVAFVMAVTLQGFAASDALPPGDLVTAPLEQANQSDLFEFPAIESPPLIRTVDASAPRYVRVLSRQVQTKLIALLMSDRMYPPGPKIASSCVFYPTVGVRFRTKHLGDVWFLYSASCRLVAYASPTADWRSLPIRLVTKAAAKEIEAITYS